MRMGEIDYLYNPYRQENLAFSLQMHLAGKRIVWGSDASHLCAGVLF